MPRPNLLRLPAALAVTLCMIACQSSNGSNTSMNAPNGGIDAPRPAETTPQAGRATEPAAGNMTQSNSTRPMDGGMNTAGDLMVHAGSSSHGGQTATGGASATGGETAAGGMPQAGGLAIPGGQPGLGGVTRDDAVYVKMTTRLGSVTIRLLPDASPIGSANFLEYVDSGFYDGQDGGGATTFHRVISGFMAQGGGVLGNGSSKQTQAPIVNESDNGLRNLRGTVAYARTSDPNSATSQFFINLVDNAFLDGTPNVPGYAVFAEVVDGMETVDAMALEDTNAADVPRNTITIERMERTQFP